MFVAMNKGLQPFTIQYTNPMTARRQNTRSKDSYNTKRYHILDTLAKSCKLEPIDVYRYLGVSGMTYQRIKLDYRTNLSMNKLYMLSGLLGYTATELLYMLERSKILDIDSKVHLSDSTLKCDNTLNSYLDPL